MAGRDRHDELDEELQGHLALAERDLIASGCTPEEARQAARRELGNLGLVREVTKDMWKGMRFERFVQDCRYGLRLMKRSAGLYAAAAVTLALGIGATTAVFSIVDAVLLRPLPFHEPERLVRVWEKRDGGRDRNVVNGWNVLDWRDRSKTLAQLAAIQSLPMNLTGDGGPVAVPAALVSAEFFEILGTRPAAGRWFAPEEAAPGKDAVVMLSHGLWQRRFGGAPGVVGRKLGVDGRPCEIVGVMPPEFAFPKSDAQLWMPLPIVRDAQWRRGRSMTTVARLAPGATLAGARAELPQISAQMALERPAEDKGWSSSVQPLLADVTHDVRAPLYVMLAGVAFLLLIACANVANLLLMRGASRQREIAVRAALGAGRARIFQQLLSEALVLSAVATALGFGVAHASLRALVAVLPSSAQLPRVETVGVDLRVLGFVLLAGLVTTVLAGLVPAFQAAGAGPQAGLRGGSLRTGTRGAHRLRAMFVTVQVALALVLLVGATLVMRSFSRLTHVDPGFRSERVLSANLRIAGAFANDARTRGQYLDRLLAEVRALPGVEAASSVHFLPLTDATSASCFAEGTEPPKVRSEAPSSEMLVVSPGYFDVLGTPLVAGRDLGAGDAGDKPSVVVVNRAFAERFFPGQDALGRVLNLCWSVENPVRVVGVVADARQTQLRQAPKPTVFIANAQSPMFFANLVLRTRDDPRQLGGSLRAAVERVNPEQSLSAIRPMTEVFARSLAQPRFELVLLAAFAALALVLATIGIFAAVTYSVAERVPEIGIRIALGAGRAEVARVVLRQALVLAAGGIAAGIGLSLLVTRVLGSILFDVTPTDPPTFVSVAALLLVVALASSLLPARRAMAVDPVVALRND